MIFTVYARNETKPLIIVLSTKPWHCQPFFFILNTGYSKHFRKMHTLNTVSRMKAAHGSGAQHPTLTIIEYADYLCFQCGKMHNHLRRLVNQYPDRIRLVHRHFPLDHLVNPMAKETVHPNSGLLSLFAIMAQKQNLFWQVNDILYREARTKQSINFSAIAKETGMDLANFPRNAQRHQPTQKTNGGYSSGNCT